MLASIAFSASSERWKSCAELIHPDGGYSVSDIHSGRSPKRTDGEWVRSAIIGDVRRGTGILNNPVYEGEVVWGRSRWIRSPRDSTIRKCEVVESPEEFVTRHDERLRIVSDDLWNAVHAILRSCPDAANNRLSVTTGKRWRTARCAATSLIRASAPIRRLPSERASITVIPGKALMSSSRPGSVARSFMRPSRSVPPAMKSTPGSLP
jgi:hypothetical protein